MKTLFPILIATLLLFSCEKELSPKERALAIQKDQKALIKAYGDIVRYINLEEVDAETKCMALPIGAKACGGPKNYISFPDSIDQEELKNMIDEYSEMEKSYNKKWEITSDCSMVMPPKENIVFNGRCKAVY